MNPARFGRLSSTDWRTIPAFYTQDLWPAKLPHSPADYGSNEFHGRTHPDVIFAAVERYTKPGDVVYDPFAGSGTTIDVCKETGNPVIAYDINPIRPDILQGDARKIVPEGFAQLAICHPPYIGMVAYDNCDMCKSHEAWKRGMHDVIDNIYMMLENERVIVFILGVLYVDAGAGYNEVICLDYEVLETLYNCFGGRLMGRIVRPYGESKGTSKTNARNENLWRYRRLAGGYWALSLDVVLFWQKLD